MPQRDIRRHHRLCYTIPARISWEGLHGSPRHAQVKCIDLSETGLRLEAPEPIPVRSSVYLRAERINLAGSATVKHVERQGAKYILGLELNSALQGEALAILRETESLRKLASL
jgi:hypothetical protein